MTEAVQGRTTILLPHADIHVFTHKDETKAASQNLQSDWRFARVQTQIFDGGVETAIEFYKKNDSPDLLLIQTDAIDDAFLEQLGSLAEYCAEGTAAIIIGPVNDVNLYRNLINMGISDYLVHPVTNESLSEDIAKSLIEKLGLSESRLIAVLGSKGGVGTTTVAVNLARGAAETYKQKTMLLDMAGGWSSLNLHLGFEPAGTLAEVTRAVEKADMDSFKRMLVKASEKLDVMATGGEVMLENPIQPGEAEEILNFTMQTWPLVIADLSGATPDVRQAVLARANHIIIVATPLLTSLRAARTLLQEIRSFRNSDGEDEQITLTVNQIGAASKIEVSVSDLAEALELTPKVELPHDPKLFIKMETESTWLGKAGQGSDKLLKALLDPYKDLLTDGHAPASDPKATADDTKSGLLSKLLPKG